MFTYVDLFCNDANKKLNLQYMGLLYNSFRFKFAFPVMLQTYFPHF